MEAYEICHPCITAVREFGLFEWFIAFLFMLFTLISVLTRMNIFMLLKSVSEAVERALNPKKFAKKEPQTVVVEQKLDAATAEKVGEVITNMISETPPPVVVVQENEKTP